ncbi:hypothetical protein P3T76_012830 [Phytophthora citrophthora]|uniref:Uncharacterized protein n=1 Tax=Phytophthora citrophthora TaxID=4793 RepID=A0AAD9G3L0_9STRA|nr:hypothetical protein P3T76_012825 [Phytophthora citrophthora]KAK1931501.1 hypothetical protein P3T76_012830 [Phytophthora citrophthora]
MSGPGSPGHPSTPPSHGSSPPPSPPTPRTPSSERSFRSALTTRSAATHASQFSAPGADPRVIALQAQLAHSQRMRETRSRDQDRLNDTVSRLRADIAALEVFRDGQTAEILCLGDEIAGLNSRSGGGSGGDMIASLQGQRNQHTAEHWDTNQRLARIQAQLDAAIQDQDSRAAELREAGEAEIEL